MTTAIVPFNYIDGAQVRTLLVDGEPWFVLADLCSVLGLARSASAVAERLDDGVRQTYPITDTLGRSQLASIVNESGMYEVVIRSDKPEAVAFRRWITGTVLPEIRRTGSYSPAAELTPAQRMAAAVLEAQHIIEQKDARIAELTGPAESWEHFASTDGDLSVNEAAKVLSRHPGIAIGERRLWVWLDEHNWTYRDAAGDRRAYQGRIESGHLTARARGHHHPGTGEWVMDAPQVRIPMKGVELLRKHLATQLAVVS